MIGAGLAAMLLGAPTWAQAPQPPASEAPGDAPPSIASPAPSPLLDMPLEDLLTLESTSVAKKRQRVADSAAAVYIITQEDIRRSSARTIPDLLRGVPGVEVAQPYTGGYAVTIRGFNSNIANTLLVMIDGRSIYVSTFSSIFWEQLLIPLNDIERIEVVRGPGATLWGANAVDGVINIVTRHSADAQGSQVDARAGPRFQDLALSHGARLANGLNYHLYGNLRHDRAMLLDNGQAASSDFYGATVGSRLDWEPNDRDAVTLQADYADGCYAYIRPEFNGNLLHPANELINVKSSFYTASTLLRWTRQQSSTVDWSLQAYYDRIYRNDFRTIRFTWQLADIDFGLHWKPNDVHDVNAGINTRIMHDHVAPDSIFNLTQPVRTDRWVSGYLQDDISLVPDTLRLTIGAKVEDNNFTGFELQPSARLFLRLKRNLSLWAAISRAVRTPSRIERSVDLVQPFIPAGAAGNSLPIPLFPEIFGSAGDNSSQLLAYEAGVRATLFRSWSLDIAAYYNRYSNLPAASPWRSIAISPAPNLPPIGIDLDIAVHFQGKAQTYGVESLLKGAVTKWWRTEFSWTHFQYSTALDPTTGQPYMLMSPLDFSPRDQFSLRNAFDISHRLSLSTQLRYVSKLRGAGVPAYTDANVRLSWQLASALDVSLIGENLLHSRRLEFGLGNYSTPLSYLPRQVTAEVQFRF